MSMKRFLSVLLLLSVVFCAVPVHAAFQYCPYCGAEVNSSYSFCPSCGKSLSVSGAQSSSASLSSGSKTGYVPGFYHTASELWDIIYQLYRNPMAYDGKPVSSFPIRLSVDLRREDGITSMNMPYGWTYSYESGVYQSGGKNQYGWCYDTAHGRYLKEDEAIAANEKIYYGFVPAHDGLGWTNSINWRNDELVVDISYYSNLNMEVIDFISRSPLQTIATFTIYDNKGYVEVDIP